MLILGVSAFYHDSAAAIIRDGEIIAAAQEERFTRIKHDAAFPAQAVRYCLAQAGRRRLQCRLYCVLREALPEIRTAARNLLGVCAAWLWIVSQSDAAVDRRENLSARYTRQRVGSDRPRSCQKREAAFFRASFFPCGLGLLSVTLRAVRRIDDGRRRRMDDNLRGTGRRGQFVDLQGDSFPALSRAALLRADLLHRIQSQLRRIQSDGPRTLWRAEVCQAHARRAH